MGAAVITDLYTIERGDAPLIVDIPHAGTFVPEPIASRLTSHARTVPDTDWHVDKLYDFVRELRVTMLVATHSRYVVDLNRDPSGVALYPGADNTELCPTRTFSGEPVYVTGCEPDGDETAARRAAFFDPYHRALAVEIERLRNRHGEVVLLDGHSIVSEAPRFFSGRLPDLNLGTGGGNTAAPEVERIACDVLAGATGFTHAINGRFTGGYVTRHYGQPRRSVHALQLEMAQCCYMDEAPPYRYEPGRAAALVGVLQQLVRALLAARGS
jgi:N-formylglutamate amidohydrolase